VYSVAAFLVSTGRLFHRWGAATLNAHSPNRSWAYGTTRSLFLTDRRVTYCWSVVTGCNMSLMYDGAMPLNDLYTRTQSLNLNSMRPRTGSQCRLNSASVTWSRDRRPHTQIQQLSVATVSNWTIWPVFQITIKYRNNLLNTEINKLYFMSDDIMAVW